MDKENCPVHKNEPLSLVHSIRNAVVGYCRKCSGEYYRKPDGAWVNRQEWKEFCKEFR